MPDAFTAGLLGAVLGAAAGAAGSSAITLLVGGRAAKSERRTARTEEALSDMLAMMEHEQWDLINAYSDLRDVETAGHTGSILTNQIVQNQDLLATSIRRMRLYVSRVEYEDVRESYRKYLEVVIIAGVALRVPGGDSAVPPPARYQERITELIRITTKRLGHEYWEPERLFPDTPWEATPS